jgi:hypothetical protein
MVMKRIQNGIAVGVLAICVGAPAMAAGARGGMAAPMTSPTMTHPTTMTGHITTTTPTTPTPKALGQPNQSCGSATAPNTPGNAANARGSAFNASGPGVADTKYAGTQPQNSNNPAAVSQYDVACFNQPH